MAVRMIRAVQKLPASPEAVWRLFANPANLLQITPANIGLKILSTQQDETIYPGQLIEYRVSPLFGIPLNWKTEIMEVRDKVFFADEQRKGPYRLWRHEHYFKPIEGGVEMTDLVKYENPYGIIGKWANTLLVRKKLRSLFEFRFKKAEEIFGKWEGQQPEIQFISI